MEKEEEQKEEEEADQMKMSLAASQQWASELQEQRVLAEIGVGQAQSGLPRGFMGNGLASSYPIPRLCLTNPRRCLFPVPEGLHASPQTDKCNTQTSSRTHVYSQAPPPCDKRVTRPCSLSRTRASQAALMSSAPWR